MEPNHTIASASMWIVIRFIRVPREATGEYQSTIFKVEATKCIFVLCVFNVYPLLF